MNPLILFAAVLAAFGVSTWLAYHFCNPTSRFHILDLPNERSLHTRPTPRSGGIAVLAGISTGGAIIGLTAEGWGILSWLFVSILPVALVSYADDRAGVPILLRVLVHLVAAALLVGGSRFILPPGFASDTGTLLAFLYVAWMINLYNFMDGMDGFAAGMAVIGFGTFAIFGWIHDHALFTSVSLIVCASAAGFLLFNFPPAKIFLGDVGSAPLGLIVAGLSLWGAHAAIFPLWVALLIFSPFIVDATITLIRRLAAGEQVWQAHRSHYYQRLVQAGWGHRKTLMWEYAVMLACAGTSVAIYSQSPETQWVMLAVWAGIYVLLIRGVKIIERDHRRRNP